ncbi:MAG: sulfatase-like hydrolase/transferase [Armatimonadota bacterium]
MADRPNILLIMSDQHSPHVLGCAGDEIVRTPNLDALADRGVRFENAYCSCPLCVPSRMGFLTSRHCQDISVWTNSCILASDIPTFVHSVGAAGYDTVLGGRMHFKGPDQRHGFHERLVGDISGANAGIPPGSSSQEYPAIELSGPGRTSYQCYDRAVLEGCQEWLGDRADSGTDTPFMMVAGFILPHCPFIAPEDLYDYYYDRVELPQVPDGYLDNPHPAMKYWRHRRGIEDVPEEEMRRASAAYYGLVEMFDSTVGGLVESLEEAGYGDDTIVIYCSDHGESLGENAMWWKSSFYEASAGVPLIVSAPGQFREGVTRSEVVSLLDLAPTLIEMTGADPLPEMDGDSLLPLLQDRPVHWRNTAMSEFSASFRGDPHARMIRSGPWKLMQYYEHEPMLFNLDEDPNEFYDRGTDPAYAHIVRELQQQVTGGWDPEGAQAAVERIRREGTVIRAWDRHFSREDPDIWDVPEGCNDFPEVYPR